MSLSKLTDEDFIFNKSDDGKISSLGYDVNSLLLEKNMSGGNILLHGNNNIMSLFKGLSIPAGLANFNQTYSGVGGKTGISKTTSKIINNDKVIDDDLHDKLINMIKLTDTVVTKKKNKKTHKSNGNMDKTIKNNETKKHGK